MTWALRQSTASQEVPLGRFVDSTDGNTEETALSIANTDIKLVKAGGTTLISKNSGGATHIANGEYYCVLDATDTDTIGPLKITIHVAGALYVQVFCTVFDEAVYDVLFGTVAPSTLAGTAQTGDVYALANGANGFVALKGDTAAILVDTGTTLDGRIPAALVGGRMDSSVGAMAANTLTAAATAADFGTEMAAAVDAGAAGVRVLLALPAVAPAANGGLGTVDANNYIAGIASGSGLNQFDDMNNLSQANVRTAIGLASANLDTQIATLATAAKLLKYVQLLTRKDAAIATDNATELTAINADGGSGAGAYVSTTDALEALRDRGDAAWATVAAAAIRSAMGLASANLDTQLAAIAGFIDTEIASILALIDTEIGDIRTRVLLALPAAAADGAGGLPISDAGGLDLDTLLARLDAAVTSRAAAATALSTAQWTNGRAALLDNADAAVSTRATPAQVNAEVVDGLNVDTYAEPGQSGWAATASLQTKIAFLAKLARNQITQDATTLSIFNDDATTVGQKATIGDSGTLYTRGEIGTGP